MKGQAAKLPPKKTQPVKEQPKEWKAEDYVSEGVPIEEVREVKAAFDIFDSDASGFVDATELKQAFVSLGLVHSNKLVYNIMHTLDGDHPNGLNFADFLKLATGRFGESHSRKQIEKVFASFDNEQNVNSGVFREK
jgi:centrin-3